MEMLPSVFISVNNFSYTFLRQQDNTFWSVIIKVKIIYVESRVSPTGSRVLGLESRDSPQGLWFQVSVCSYAMQKHINIIITQENNF